jgi:alkylation response protein AidB-like acyl-CoA dehydrogenase
MYKTDVIDAAWRGRITSLAEKHINPKAVKREQNATFDRSVWAACANAGLTGLTVAKAYGGQGLGALDTVKVLEVLGYASEDPGLNFGVAAHLLAVLVPIAQFGSEEQKKRFLPGFCDGSLIAGNAITERTAGSDVFNMQTVARPYRQGYLLTGTKAFCSNGKSSDVVLTYAMTQPEKGFFGGISAFLLVNGDTNFSWSEDKSKLGLRSCSLAEVIMNDTYVEEGLRLGQEGAGGPIFNASMNWERACLGAIHLGAMDRLLEQAVAFANDRYSGGQNLSARQAVTHPLAELKVRLEGARLLTYRAAQAIDEGLKKNTFCSLAKLAVSECYRDLGVQLMQLFAGAAYQTPHPVEIQLKAALGATLYSGTSEIHRNLVASDMGLRPKQSK